MITVFIEPDKDSMTGRGDQGGRFDSSHFRQPVSGGTVPHPVSTIFIESRENPKVIGKVYKDTLVLCGCLFWFAVLGVVIVLILVRLGFLS